MKDRLTFTEMQTFINGVVSGVMENGMGYKRFYIDYYAAVLYGEHDFGGTEDNPRDIDSVYEELFDVEIYEDKEQYDTILKAIDEEIMHQLNMVYKPFTDLEVAAVNLVDKLANLVDKLGEIDTDKTAEFISLLLKNKGNFSMDSIVKAMKANGLVGKTSRKKKDTVISVAENTEKVKNIKL